MATVYRIAAYPKQVQLRDGSEVTIRPLEPSDGPPLLQFFRGLSDDDRFFLKDDVASEQVIRSWTEGLDYRRALPLIASVNGHIVAEAVLVRRRGNARNHVGELRVTVAPDWRARGLGSILIRELCDIADDAEMDKVLFEVVAGNEEDALQAAERLGFIRAGTIEGGARDPQSHLHDVVLMIMPLGKWYQWTKY